MADKVPEVHVALQKYVEDRTYAHSMLVGVDDPREIVEATAKLISAGAPPSYVSFFLETSTRLQGHWALVVDPETKELVPASPDLIGGRITVCDGATHAHALSESYAEELSGVHQ